MLVATLRCVVPPGREGHVSSRPWIYAHPATPGRLQTAARLLGEDGHHEEPEGARPRQE